MIEQYFWQNFLSFLFICFTVAFTLTAIKHEDWKKVVSGGIRYFVLMTGGILAFCLVVFLVEKFIH